MRRGNHDTCHKPFSARKASPAIAEIRNWNSSHTATTWRQFVWYNPNLLDTNDAAHGFILPAAVGLEESGRSGSLPMGDPESKSVQIAGSATDCLMPHSMLQNQKSWQQWQLFVFLFRILEGRRARAWLPPGLGQSKSRHDCEDEIEAASVCKLPAPPPMPLCLVHREIF